MLANTMSTSNTGLIVPIDKAFSSLAAALEHDVWLQGTDGITVSANRKVLAARCEFFRTMFQTGRFQEGTSNVVPIGYSSGVLQAVVEYIYTSTFSLYMGPDVEFQLDVVSKETLDKFNAFIGLLEAAEYFGLMEPGEKERYDEEGLYRKAHTSAFLATSKPPRRWHCCSGRDALPKNLLLCR